MTSKPEAEAVEYGWECHDCGEVYAPSASTADCVEQGHYVGPIAACELPLIERHFTKQASE
ncbi:MAG: hypothetical protein O3B65_00955 [Chloroflexi bacterium]|nr:hypothetical protein [Chloroflexota bacterium]